MKKNKNWNNSSSQELFKAIVSLKTAEEARRFFRDLCTPEELIDMADRWQAAKLLYKDVDYRQIADKLGMSTTTVGRVANWLRRGMGGYLLVLNRLTVGSHHTASSRRER
ncbi:MAG: YerC/YecD family TrpR-related protein [Patescibacteria group bacterium]